MIDRLRALLDRPLDPSAARAILVFASASLVGFALLVVLAQGEQPGRSLPRPKNDLVATRTLPTGHSSPASKVARPMPYRQDPQDRKGSAVAMRAGAAIRAHRALQHLPYRDGRLRIVLVGARGTRAVVRVIAPSVLAARLGWRRFLRRYRDSGAAYLPLFDERGGGSRG